MTARAFVARDPRTGRRLGVAWSELDAVPMLYAADARIGHTAELLPVDVSRTPEAMREDRRERLRRERLDAERALEAARLLPPEGYTVRRYPPLSPSTLRRRFDPGRALLMIADANDWTPYDAGPYGQETIPLERRGLILIADPPGGRPSRSRPRLYIATAKGRRAAAALRAVRGGA